MKAVVVYESLWGNTAAIARAIAEGLGPGAEALTTDAASAGAVAEADLIVTGAPARLQPAERPDAGECRAERA